MNKSSIRYLAVGAIGFVSLSQAVVAGEPGPAPQITVYVYNWAQVESNTLREAKEVVARIFHKAGVEATLLEVPLSSGEERSDTVQQFRSSQFFLQILSLSMAKNFGFPTQVLGIAPGDPQELNRDQVYVFDHVAARMAQDQLAARENRTAFINASKGMILGHGMAHEIAHVLLYQASHAPEGLMRAHWDRTDFENMVGGNLLFTSEEAERVRAEVSRRNAGE